MPSATSQSEAGEARPATAVTDLGGKLAPAMELIYERGTPAFRGQWLDIERRLVLVRPRPDAGDWASPYLSLARERAVRETAPSGAAETVEAGVLQDNPAGRLRAMDAAGVATQLLSPEGSVDACFPLPSNLAVGMLGAYNLYATTYCEADPARLKAVLQVHGGEPQWSAKEILAFGADPAVAAVTVFLPIKLAPDSPNFAQIWEALEETGLPLYFRPAVAARAWTPQRLLTYLSLSGVLERHPALRIAFAMPAGADWLGEWLRGARRSGRSAAAAEELLAARRVFAQLAPSPPPDPSAAAPADAGDGPLLWGSGFPLVHGASGEIAVPALAPTRREAILAANPSDFLATAG